MSHIWRSRIFLSPWVTYDLPSRFTCPQELAKNKVKSLHSKKYFFFSFIFLWVFVYIVYLCRPSEASTWYCVIPGGYPPQDWQSLPCAEISKKSIPRNNMLIYMAFRTIITIFLLQRRKLDSSLKVPRALLSPSVFTHTPLFMTKLMYHDNICNCMYIYTCT